MNTGSGSLRQGGIRGLGFPERGGPQTHGGTAAGQYPGEGALWAGEGHGA